MSRSQRKNPKLLTIDIEGLPDLETDRKKYNQKIDSLSQSKDWTGINPLNQDDFLNCKLFFMKLSFLTIILGSTATCYILVKQTSINEYYSLLFLLFLFNLIVISVVAKWALGFILFPFSTWIMNYRYHFFMNQKMINEV